jgi:hypothetical protein
VPDNTTAFLLEPPFPKTSAVNDKSNSGHLAVPTDRMQNVRTFPALAVTLSATAVSKYKFQIY